MNRLISKMILMATIAWPCLAQDQGRSEISASYSILPSENTLGNIWLGFSNKGPHGNRNLTIRRGAFFATYKYFITDRIAVGAATGFNRYANESNFRYTDFTGLNAQTVTTAGEVTWIYFKKPAIKLYAMAGLGFYTMRASVDNYHTATTTNGAAMQIIPIGIRFGKKMGVFTELGYGYKGIINTGVSVKF